MTFWNPGQKHLIGTSFIPENKKPVPFSELRWPSNFCYKGDAYRKLSPGAVMRLDSGEIVELEDSAPCYRNTSAKSRLYRKGSLYI